MSSMMNKKQANQSLPEESKDMFVTQVDNLEDNDSSLVQREQVRAEELKNKPEISVRSVYSSKALGEHKFGNAF